MVKSRTENSARNAMVAIVGRILAILTGFCTRIVFTHTLSQDYAGISGLFSDILKVLSISELGAGTAITFALYRPIAQGDKEKQKSLMRLFRRFYHIVAAVVFFGGLTILPFMDVLIKGQPEVEHLTLIYLLYLSNSALSYFQSYKRMLVDAHQLSYIGVLIQMSCYVLQNILQIAVLLISRNFILFVCVTLLCTLLNNIVISYVADRLYPYLREKDVAKLPGSERKSIFQNIRAMLMHKIGTVAVNNTDNLLLSSLVGLTSNGRYFTYSLVIGSVRQVLDQAFQGIAASVGNLGTEQSRSKVKRVFESTFFLGQWIYGLAAVCAYEVIDPFIGFCFGDAYVFPRQVTVILCLNFYLAGMRQPALIFRESLGIFRQDRYKALAEVVINLGASIVLGLRLGTAGVFLGTIVSTVSTSLWIEPLTLYRHGFNSSVRPHFMRYGLYLSVTFLLWYAEDLLCRQIVGGIVFECLVRLLVCGAATNLVYFLLYRRTQEYRLLMEEVLKPLYGRFCMRLKRPR